MLIFNHKPNISLSTKMNNTNIISAKSNYRTSADTKLLFFVYLLFVPE